MQLKRGVHNPKTPQATRKQLQTDQNHYKLESEHQLSKRRPNKSLSWLKRYCQISTGRHISTVARYTPSYRPTLHDTQNFKNVLLTLATKHQDMLAYYLDRDDLFRQSVYIECQTFFNLRLGGTP